MKQKIAILSMVLALVMCFGVAVPAWAGEADSGVWETKIVEVNGYSFEIQELVKDDLAIERRYINPTPDVRIEDVEQAKALLIALGMDAGNLALWEDASLLSAANGKDISMVVADYRVDDEADVVLSVQPEIANSDAMVTPAVMLWGLLIVAILVIGVVIWLKPWRVKCDLAELETAQEKADGEHKEK